MGDNLYTRGAELKFSSKYKIPKKADDKGFNLNQDFQNAILSSAYESGELYQQTYISRLKQDVSRSKDNQDPAPKRNVDLTNRPNPLKRPREAPTTTSAPVTYGDMLPYKSPSLPKELLEQFQPLYCKLCSARLSSIVMAKSHYQSKKHEKKVHLYLVDYSQRTGEPYSDKRQKCDDDDDSPRNFYCHVCDLPLTGRKHAESHYMGKNHLRASAGRPPATKGHYDQEGKWKRKPTIPGSDRDNIGLDFVADGNGDGIVSVDTTIRGLYCEICSVNVSSEQQMIVHINGQKHKRNTQLLNEKVVESPQGNPEKSILSASSSNIPSDLSAYRTPSGFYYCNPCNLTMNSKIQFTQHLGSKKHKKKANVTRE